MFGNMAILSLTKSQVLFYCKSVLSKVYISYKMCKTKQAKLRKTIKTVVFFMHGMFRFVSIDESFLWTARIWTGVSKLGRILHKYACSFINGKALIISIIFFDQNVACSTRMWSPLVNQNVVTPGLPERGSPVTGTLEWKLMSCSHELDQLADPASDWLVTLL